MLVEEWERSILPMYKPSTQKHRRFMLTKHLLPEFGDRVVCEITRQDVQGYVARLMRHGYASKSIDHIHDVLSAILRTAMKWGHLSENPARGVELPTLRCVRPEWALTPAQAATLMGHANVDTTLNVYTQVLDGSVRDAVERVGNQMNAIERNSGGAEGTTTATARIA